MTHDTSCMCLACTTKRAMDLQVPFTTPTLMSQSCWDDIVEYQEELDRERGWTWCHSELHAEFLKAKAEGRLEEMLQKHPSYRPARKP